MMKMMNKPQMRLILIMFALVAAGLACSLPSSASPTLPPTAVPMSTEQIQQFQEKVKATIVNGAPSGETTIVITQDDLNAYLSAQMQNQTDKTLTDPSVILSNGQANVFARVSQGNLSAVAKIVLEPNVDADGNVKLQVVSINLGPIPVPDALKSQLSGVVDSMLDNYVNQAGNQIKVKAITITEGQMTVTGVPR